jgi:hypothetical protein
MKNLFLSLLNLLLLVTGALTAIFFICTVWVGFWAFMDDFLGDGVGFENYDGVDHFYYHQTENFLISLACLAGSFILFLILFKIIKKIRGTDENLEVVDAK